MLRFPLRKKIILFTEIGNIICQIEYAGKNTLKLKDAVKEMYTDHGNFYYSDVKKEIIVDRHKVIGYSNICSPHTKKKHNVGINNVINIATYNRG